MNQTKGKVKSTKISQVFNDGSEMEYTIEYDSSTSGPCVTIRCDRDSITVPIYKDVWSLMVNLINTYFYEKSIEIKPKENHDK